MNPAHEDAIYRMLKMGDVHKRDRKPLSKDLIDLVTAAEKFYFNAMNMVEMRFDVIASLLAVATQGGKSALAPEEKSEEKPAKRGAGRPKKAESVGA